MKAGPLTIANKTNPTSTTKTNPQHAQFYAAPIQAKKGSQPCTSDSFQLC